MARRNDAVGCITGSGCPVLGGGRPWSNLRSGAGARAAAREKLLWARYRIARLPRYPSPL